MTETTDAAGTLPQEARKWATICHLSALVGLMGNGVGFLLAPLIVWLIKRDEHPFIDAQGKDAVNFQLTMFLALLVGAILALVLIGFVVMLVAGVLMTVLPIVAAVKSNRGESYSYPLTIRFIR